MWGKIYSFFKRIKNILVFVLFAAFGFSMLAHIVSPNTTIVFAPFGLSFIPLLLATLFVGIIYLRRNKWITLASFSLIAMSLQFLAGTFSINFNQKETGLKIMSWNVKNFDLYNWTKNQETRKRMFAIIDSASPDLLCLQEFYTDKDGHDNVTALKKLGYPYFSFNPAYKQKDGSQWGLAIFSKYKLENGRAIALNPKKSSINQCVSAKLNYKGKIYSVYNAHLQSIHLDYEDLDYIAGVKKEWSFMDKIKSWRIMYKILTAYKSRTQQVEKLLAEQNKDENVILCCDLNDIPASYAYHALSKNYQDAFRKKGCGLSNTISVGFPVYRIDYIFASPSIDVNSYQKIENSFSDHHIIMSHMQ